jgi:VCBS repeat-containing protein
VVTNPTKGSLSGTAPNLTYTPTSNLNGPDSFTFKVNDGKVDSATATVSITINPINDVPVANAQSVTTDEDTAKAITLTGSDVDGDSLTYTVVTNPTKGSLSGTAPNLTYTPTANLNGSDSFTFKVNDGTVDSAIATVSITINAVNDAPVANAQSVTTDEDTAKDITLTGSDVEGSALTYTVIANPTKGTLSGIAPNLTYTPTANQNGSDSFTFKVNDGGKDSSTATVSITINPINDAPVANAQSVSTDEDTAKAITLTGSDVDGNSLTYTVVTSPTKGSLSGTAPSLTYTPTANENGSDSFTFKVNDGTVDSAIATVSITINAVNDAPVANAQSVTTDEDTAKTITLTGSDVEGSVLTYLIVTNPTKGTLSGTAPALTYTPTADQNGSDSFTFKVNDGSSDSVAATVSITINPINDAPVITEGPSASVAMSKNGTPTAFSLTLHATDVDSSDTLTWGILTAAAHGTAAASGTGASIAISYTPTTGYTGSDSFVVKVTDSGSATDQITVNVTITAVTHTISITRSGTADVTITSNPSGINCGNSATACSMTVDYGTVVTLNATPASDYYRLASWAGDCTGSSTCSVTATVDKAITANIETATFSDVPFDHPRWAYIETLWENGLTAGCSTSPLKFCPDQTMTRAESAAFLMRGLYGSSYVPPAVTGIFTGDNWSDASISWGQKWAEALYNAGLTSGCGTSPLKFCPTRTTTRIEGATFGEALYHDGVGYTVPPASGNVFADLTDTTYWGTKYAELAYTDGLMLATGIDTGTGKPIFSADADLDRSWAAFIIVKALNLPTPD